MSRNKRGSQEQRAAGKSKLFGNPDVVILPSEKSEGEKTRKLVSSIIRSAWSAAQDWTMAWKSGVSQLKTVVGELVGTQQGDHLDQQVHNAAQQLAEAVAKMKSCVRTMEELLEQLQNLQRLQKSGAGQPLFSSLTLQQMVSVMECVCDDYRKETEVKAGACTPLPSTSCPDTLNTLVTLWTHHTHVVTHQYPLKLLLRETQQL